MLKLVPAPTISNIAINEVQRGAPIRDTALSLSSSPSQGTEFVQRPLVWTYAIWLWNRLLCKQHLINTLRPQINRWHIGNIGILVTRSRGGFGQVVWWASDIFPILRTRAFILHEDDFQMCSQVRDSFHGEWDVPCCILECHTFTVSRSHECPEATHTTWYSLWSIQEEVVNETGLKKYLISSYYYSALMHCLLL